MFLFSILIIGICFKPFGSKLLNSFLFSLLVHFHIRINNIFEQTSKILTDAANLHPSDPLIQFNLGCYAAQRGDLTSAQGHVRRAIELDHDLEKLAHEDPDLEPLRQAHLID